MNDVWDYLNLLWAPFGHFLDPADRLSYLYLVSALVIAVVAYVITQAGKGELQSAGLIKWLLPMDVLRHPSAQADFAFYFINKILIAAIYGSVLLSSPYVRDVSLVGLEAIFGPRGAGAESSVWLSVLTTLVIAMVLDFTLWFLHYIFHLVPFLWDYHKVHHSAEVMTPITAARMHPVEEVMDATVTSLTIGFTYAAMTYLLGPAAVELTLFETNIVLAIFFFAAFNLRHSHVWIRYPYWLQHIFICPAQHQIHHSTKKKHWDKNMGFVFSFWDWAAGTLYAPKEREEITFGLGTAEDGGTWHSVRALYLLPFRQSWEKIRPKKLREPAE